MAHTVIFLMNPMSYDDFGANQNFITYTFSDQIQDKVFVAAENEVRGYNKKGKLFLSFETTLTEPIQHMYF